MTTSISRPKKKRTQINPNSLANLIPYKKGENGHGRVYPLKERLRHALDHPLTKPKDDAPAGEHIVYATLKGAIDLVPSPFHEVWDRVEGKVPGDNQVVLQDNRAINIIVSSDKAKELTEKIGDRLLMP